MGVVDETAHAHENEKPMTPLSEAAADVLETDDDDAPRGPGRPRGRKDRRKRRPRSRGARSGGGPNAPRAEAAPAPTAPVAPPAEPTPEEIAGVGKLCKVAWQLLAKRFQRETLTDDEANGLAAAAIPVIRKYAGPELEKWGPEIGLGLVVVVLWESKAIRDTALEVKNDAERGLVPA